MGQNKTMSQLINLNGRILTRAEASLSVFDRGFLYGDAVFETGRTYDGKLLFLEDHLKRLEKSAAGLQLSLPLSKDDFKKELEKTLRAFSKSPVSYRIIVTGGEQEELGLDVEGEKPSWMILVQDLSEKLKKLQTEGYHLKTSKFVRDSSEAQNPQVKSNNYFNSIRALREVKAQGAMDAIFLNSKGLVTEGTNFNVFSVSQEGILRTPSLQTGILAGITRKYILELATPLMKVEEGEWDLKSFTQAKEVFVASSLREICPVFQWDENRYQVIGPFTKKLQKAYQGKIKSLLESELS